MSLISDMRQLDAQVAELTPPQREAIQAACAQIAAAMANLGTAIPDGTSSPIAATVQALLFDAALCFRPGKGFSGLKPKMLAALEQCPTLREVAADFIAKFNPQRQLAPMPANELLPPLPSDAR